MRVPGGSRGPAISCRNCHCTPSPATVRHSSISAPELNDGKTRAAKVAHPRGTGDRNLTNAEIREKYTKLTRKAVSAKRHAAIEKAVLDVDALDDVPQLTALLTPAVHSPLD